MTQSRSVLADRAALAREKARATALHQRYGGQPERLTLAEARKLYGSRATAEKLDDPRRFDVRYRRCTICGRYPAVALRHYERHESGALDAAGHVTDPGRRAAVAQRVAKRRETLQEHAGPGETFGVRELRAGLSAHLRRVRAGETLRVMDRGEPIALIIPVGIPAGLERLLSEGRASWGGAATGAGMPLARLRGAKTAAQHVVEDRDTREHELDRAFQRKKLVAGRT